jgi:hypothetical protein
MNTNKIFKQGFQLLVKASKFLIMKKAFLVIACAILSMSIFAQTPQQTTSSTATNATHHSSKVKRDRTNTKNSKTTLAQDKTRLKSDKAANTSAQIQKQDKKLIKKDKVAVKQNKKTEKKDKKAVAKKSSKKTPVSSTNSKG